MNEIDKLTGRERFDIVVQSGLQLIPYIGGSLSTAYYGVKQEKRFKRIESFYQEFSNMIEQNNITLQNPNPEENEQLVQIIEELNEKVEREHYETKREYFKKFLLTTLTYSSNKNFDEVLFFLDTLSSMTLLECEILTILYKNKDQEIPVKSLHSPSIDIYAIIGSIGKLKSYGFVSSRITDFNFNGTQDPIFNESISVSSFGIRFVVHTLN